MNGTGENELIAKIENNLNFVTAIVQRTSNIINPD